MEWLYVPKSQSHQLGLCLVPAHVGVVGTDLLPEVLFPPHCLSKTYFQPICLVVQAGLQWRWEALAAITKLGEISLIPPNPMLIVVVGA